MRSLGKMSIRGSIVIPNVEKLNLFDGSFGTGFKVTKFVIAPQDVNDSEKMQAKLMTQDQDHSAKWYWDNNLEVAWATWNTPTNSRAGDFNLVDRDNIIVEDLFIDTTGDTDEVLNYYIEMEKFDIGLSLGAYSMVRNSSQNLPE